MAFVLLEGFVGMGGMTDFGRAHGGGFETTRVQDNNTSGRCLAEPEPVLSVYCSYSSLHGSQCSV
jgi:hypothetical protein